MAPRRTPLDTIRHPSTRVSKLCNGCPPLSRTPSSVSKYLPEHCPPPNWEKILDGVRTFRLSTEGKAPVDSMGIEAISTNSKPQEDVDTRRFRTLLGLMLSSQTKDEVTMATVQRLIKDNGCSVSSISSLSVGRLDELIARVGFHHRKAQYIHEAACRIQREYKGHVPGDLATLQSFNGVGPKMSLLFQQICDGVVEGISVDVHMHRIFGRWKWVNSETCSNPEHTRKALEAWLPQEHWSSINLLVVGFGQTLCQAKRPKCNQCPISKLCPSAPSLTDIEEVPFHGQKTKLISKKAILIRREQGSTKTKRQRKTLKRKRV